MHPPDLYEVLQVSRNAESEVIEAAYRRLAQKYHFDRNSEPDAHERMTLINEAFATLSDPERRAAYDLSRAYSSQSHTANENGSAQTGPEATPDTTPPPSRPRLRWTDFCFYPFGPDPRAFWIVLAVFGLGLPVIFRWILGSMGTGWLASIAGGLAGGGLLALNWKQIPIETLVKKHITSPETRTDLRIVFFKILGSLSFFGGLLTIGLVCIANEIDQASAGAHFARLISIEWGVVAGLAPLGFLWFWHWRYARKNSTEGAAKREIPAALYRIVAIACISGGILGPSSPYELRLRASRDRDREDWAGARTSLDRALDRYPNYVEALQDRAVISKKQGKPDQAIQDLNRALDLEPNNPYLLVQRAWIHFHEGRTGPAIQDAQRAADISQSSDLTEESYREQLSSAQSALAYFHLSGNELDRAIELAEQAVRLNSRNLDAHYVKGRVLLDKGQIDQAIISFDEAIKLNPNGAAIYWYRSKSWQKKGDTVRERSDREQAIRLDPSFATKDAPPPPIKLPEPAPVRNPPPKLPDTSVSFRKSVVGKGMVMTVGYHGLGGGAVSVRMNSRPDLSLGYMSKGAFKEAGWLEFGTELKSGDSVEVLVNGKRDQLVTVP